MSKLVKQMEMDTLTRNFSDVRDLVLLSVSGLNAVTENSMRLALRKKNIRMQMVKNTLISRVWKDMGIGGLEPFLQGPTTVAWGSSSIADLSKELDVWIKKNEKTIKTKAAVADGAVVTFDAAKKFPTRVEAISRVITLALSPARRIAGQIAGPASRVAGQIKTISEKAEAAAPAAAA